MKQNHASSKSQKNSLHYDDYLLKNIFDEKFLNEKDKALSPIILSDIIPGETIKKHLKKTKKKAKNIKINEEKDINYGSNIELIESKKDDNGEEIREILNEQICEIIDEQNFKNFVKNLLMGNQ